MSPYIINLYHSQTGDDRDRTGDLWLAKPPLSQLSYIPEILMGLKGVEPLTSRLSGVRSNQLSYRPSVFALYGLKFITNSHGVMSQLFMSLDLDDANAWSSILNTVLLRKEVIQPQLPLRLPCYDLVPLADHTLGTCLPRRG